MTRLHQYVKLASPIVADRLLRSLESHRCRIRYCRSRCFQSRCWESTALETAAIIVRPAAAIVVRPAAIVVVAPLAVAIATAVVEFAAPTAAFATLTTAFAFVMMLARAEHSGGGEKQNDAHRTRRHLFLAVLQNAKNGENLEISLYLCNLYVYPAVYWK